MTSLSDETAYMQIEQHVRQREDGLWEIVDFSRDIPGDAAMHVPGCDWGEVDVLGIPASEVVYRTREAAIWRYAYECGRGFEQAETAMSLAWGHHIYETIELAPGTGCLGTERMDSEFCLRAAAAACMATPHPPSDGRFLAEVLEGKGGDPCD